MVATYWMAEKFPGGLGPSLEEGCGAGDSGKCSFSFSVISRGDFRKGEWAVTIHNPLET